MQGIRVAILGNPNVGKSSLFNFIAKREVSIVTNIAGTTRDSIEIAVDVDGIMIRLVDTAGIRESDDPIEHIGVQRSMEHASVCDIRVIVCDQTGILPKSMVRSQDIVAVNKIDNNPNYDIMCATIRQKYGCRTIPISVKEGLNVEKLLKEIADNARSISGFDSGSVYLDRRHFSLLKNTISELGLATEVEEIEIIAEHLRRAAFLIGRITGHVSSDDILSEIFGSFCIGK